MLRLFKTSDPISLIILIIYAVLLNCTAIIDPYTSAPPQYYLISSIIFNKWLHLPLLPIRVTVIINIAFIITQAVLISNLLQGYKIISKPSLLPALSFIVLCSLFPQLTLSTPVITSGFFLVWALFKVFSVYNKTKADNIYFDTGLLSAIAALLFPPSVIFSLFILFALVRIRTTTFREFTLFISGLFIIFFIAATALFWFDLLPVLLKEKFFILPDLQFISKFFTTLLIVKLVIIGIALLVSIIFYNKRFSANLIQVRKYLGTFVMLFFFAIISFLMNKSPGEPGLYFLLISISIFISYYFFHSQKQAGPELMHLGLLGAAIIFQYINFTA